MLPKVADSLAFPKVFGAAFLKGAIIKQDSARYTFSTYDLGRLTSLSGKLVAGDPIVLTDRPAFTQRFPVGSFPVQLALAKLTNDERVGFARVLFSTARVAKWELARLPGEKPLALKDSSFYCYGVDAGMGAFINSVTNRHLAEQSQATWDKIFMRKPEQPGYKGYIYSFGAGNLATFLTGFGDGCYATYIGFDAQGRVCQLLTDFGLVVW
ncbi:DUF4241 domain-containing protein [Siccationidurans ginsengisoli]|uniref:DUF4241 domain-containing protein n=1 Tax=Hymenobacter TaxID=89966 RepID=UPI001AACC853|nr:MULTISPECIES: DUF4241 domain-containing protein [unclassified Hymenobacter]MBO2032444.1 DUF4241 domain-containing protein [Hymenobacter sp. BT559]